jgi:hypothetical protein
MLLLASPGRSMLHVVLSRTFTLRLIFVKFRSYHHLEFLRLSFNSNLRSRD